MLSTHATMLLPKVFLSLLFPAVVVALQLPPEIQADRHIMQAKMAIAEQDFRRAKTAMDAILELQAQHDLKLPEHFSFRYAEVLDRLGLHDEAIKYVTKYLTVSGRGGKYYRAALRLLDSAEEKLEQIKTEERRIERDRRRAEALQQEHEEQIKRQVKMASRGPLRDPLASGGLGPEMVKIARGRFQYYHSMTGLGSARQLKWVTFGKPFAIGKYEVTRGEFEQFVRRTRYRTEAERDPKHGCKDPRKSAPTKKSSLRWNRPGFEQTDTHPVTCVSTRDAIAYAEWLSRETGHTYRVPSAAEWEYAARAGSSAAMLFIEEELLDGEDPNVCRHGNLRDSSTGFQFAVKCGDGARHTVEVGRFLANVVGLYDMIGNVSELVLACAIERDNWISRSNSPAPEHPDSCQAVVASGSSWYSGQTDALDYREWNWTWATPHRDGRYYLTSSTTEVGFRVVMDLPEDPTPK